MPSIFRQALEEAQRVFKESVLEDVNNEEFEWTVLAKIATEDDTPIRQVFSDETIKLAYLLERSVYLDIAADNANLSEIDEGEENEAK